MIDVLSILPHRYPFVLIDRVTECETGKSIKAFKNVTYNEPFFEGHFPGNPIMPGALQVEAMAQAGAVLCYLSKLCDAKTHLAVLAGLDRVRYKKPVLPGDRLDLTVHLLGFKKSIAKLQAYAYVQQDLVSQAVIWASIQRR